MPGGTASGVVGAGTARGWRLSAQLLRPTSLTSAGLLGKRKWRLLRLRHSPAESGVQLAARPPRPTAPGVGAGWLPPSLSWGAQAGASIGHFWALGGHHTPAPGSPPPHLHPPPRHRHLGSPGGDPAAPPAPAALPSRARRSRSRGCHLSAVPTATAPLGQPGRSPAWDGRAPSVPRKPVSPRTPAPGEPPAPRGGRPGRGVGNHRGQEAPSPCPTAPFCSPWAPPAGGTPGGDAMLQGWGCSDFCGGWLPLWLRTARLGPFPPLLPRRGAEPARSSLCFLHLSPLSLPQCKTSAFSAGGLGACKGAGHLLTTHGRTRRAAAASGHPAFPPAPVPGASGGDG